MESQQTEIAHSLERIPYFEVAEPSVEIKRGCAPSILLGHVDVTMPYLWSELPSDGKRLKYLKTLQTAHTCYETHQEQELFFSHSDYYELCVSAHFATVGSFVPTDVDNQIRFKLWHPTLEDDVIHAMADVVDLSRHWDVTPVTTRHVQDPKSNYVLTGHAGEWFTISAAAYGALRRRDPKRAKEILDQIQEEIARETEAYCNFKKVKDGKGLLIATAMIAHNIGDLLRVIDMWNLDESDPLRLAYKAAHTKDYFDGALLEMGELYKALAANDNHRHFPLRAAKCLRRSPDFLLPIGPFFDQWGRKVARHPLLSEEDIGDVVECLIDGFHKLDRPVGYARALCGIESAFPGGATALGKMLPKRVEKNWKTGELRTLCSVTQERFESQWESRVLKFVNC